MPRAPHMNARPQNPKSCSHRQNECGEHPGKAGHLVPWIHKANQIPAERPKYFRIPDAEFRRCKIRRRAVHSEGVGRLIRSKTDTGTIVILDSRIVSKPNGKSFLRDAEMSGRVH